MTVTQVVRMMIWEAWRLTWQSLFLRVVIVSLVAVFLVDRSQQRVDANGRDLVLLGVFSLIILQAVLSCLYAKFGEDRPGFPFYLGYTRPVPTWLLVLVPMGYFVLSMVAIYLFPVLLLVLVFDARLPLLTGTLIISVAAVICAMCNWWSVDKLQRGLTWLLAYLTFDQLLFQNVVAPGRQGAIIDYLVTATILDFPGLVAAALLAVAVTVFGVEKQRHGDVVDLSRLFIPGRLKVFKGSLLKGEFLTSLDWLKGLYVRRCPTHSPVAAEVWREMKIRGVPVIAAGILVSIIVPVIWFLMNLATTAGYFPKAPPGTPPAQLPLLFTLTLVTLSFPLLIGTANLFGIRKQQGRVDFSKFDATLPITTIHYIGLRLSIALGSLFVSLLIMGITLWHSTPLLIDIYDYSSSKTAFMASLDAMTWFEILRSGFVKVLQLITVVVFFGIMQLLWALYARRILYGVAFFMIYVVLIAVSARNDWTSVDFLAGQLWVIIVAVVISTFYVMFDVLRRYVLSPWQAAALIGIGVLFVPAYFSIQVSSGLLDFSMPTVLIGWVAMISILPLTAAVLAPWTVSRFRNR